MKFMMMVKADKDYEAGIPPSPALMAAVGQITEEMMNAGVVVETGGLLPSAGGPSSPGPEPGDGDGRPLHGSEGAGRRLRDHPRRLQGGRDRSRRALPE